MSGTERIETKRLVLRKHEKEDADWLYRILGMDPKCMRILDGIHMQPRRWLIKRYRLSSIITMMISFLARPSN